MESSFSPKKMREKLGLKACTKVIFTMNVEDL